MPAALFLIYILVLVRTAWLSDDAYITFRTIDNLFQGHGLTWNVAERVQAYTHPLWLGAVTAGRALTGKLPASAVGLSLVSSIGAVALLAGLVARSWRSAWFCLLLLLGSRSFVDYSSSGLENPLSHLILVSFASVYFHGARTFKSALASCCLACLAALNRPDSVILYLPALGLLVWKGQPRRHALAGLAGFSPLLLWEAFSVFYYGFPLPNTAYAKLNLGIPASELVPQGLRYALHSVLNDPLTPLGIMAGVALALRNRRPNEMALGAGIVFHLVYVVWIGGDFMAGRFFSLPLIASACILARQQLRDLRAFTALTSAVIALALLTPYPPVLSGPDYGERTDGMVDPWGLSDERAIYYPFTGLLRTRGSYEVPTHPWMRQGLALSNGSERVVRGRAIGFLGYFAGPDIHIIDQFALADALLARLPPNVDPEWRPGHFDRRIPDGYQMSLVEGVNLVSSEALRGYYDEISLIIQGPLWDSARWQAILAFNLGRYDHLVDEYVRGQYQQLQLAPAGAPSPLQAGKAPASGPIHSNRGVWIELGTVYHAGSIGLELPSEQGYAIVLINRGRPVFRTFPHPSSAPSVSRHDLRVPLWPAIIGYDAILIIPMDGIPFALEGLELNGAQRGVLAGG